MRKSHNLRLQPSISWGACLTKMETKISQSMKALSLQLKTDNDVHTWPSTYFDTRRPGLDLDAAIRERHSTRMFLPQQPVPLALVDEAFALAGSPIPKGYIEFQITVRQFGRLVRLVLSRHSTRSLRLVSWQRLRFRLAASAQQAPSPLTSDPSSPTGSFVPFNNIS
jgi:hypothetical protein